MKKLLFTLLFAITIQVGFAQTAQQRKDLVENPAYEQMLQGLLSRNVQEVSASEVAAMENVVLLDAREWNEYAVSHIKGAEWIGYDDFNMMRVAHLDKEEKIVVYCSVGYRSEKITEQLMEFGYTNVANMYGSLFEWMNQGYPVYDESGKRTDKIHAYDEHWGQWVKKGVRVYK